MKPIMIDGKAWALVPLEATDEMLEAPYKPLVVSPIVAAHIWWEMIHAAPDAPARVAIYGTPVKMKPRRIVDEW